MPCTPFSRDGMTGFLCTSGRAKRCACGARATQLCDWKVEGKRSGTCDAPICTRCAVSPAPEKDLCSDHAAAWEKVKHRYRKAAP